MKKKTKHRRPPKFFTRMNDQELLNYCRSHNYHTLTKSTLAHKDSGLYRVMVKRGLIEFIDTKIDPYKNYTPQQLIQHCKKTHGVFFLDGLCKADNQLYHVLIKQNLITTELKMNHSTRRKYSNMTDTEVKQYYHKHYKNLTLKKQLKEKNPSLYSTMYNRGLFTTFPDTPGKKRTAYFNSLHDEQLIAYLFRHHPKLIISQLSNTNPPLYQQFKKRKLLHILPRKHKSKQYSTMSNEVLQNEYQQNFKGLTRTELSNTEPALYNNLRKKNLLTIIPLKNRKPNGYWNDITIMVELQKIKKTEGVDPSLPYLIKTQRTDLICGIMKNGGIMKYQSILGYRQYRKKSGAYLQWETFSEEIHNAIKQNNGEFPTQGQLAAQGRTGLNRAIHKYYGGFGAVRERIGYNQQKREELAQKLEEIVRNIT